MLNHVRTLLLNLNSSETDAWYVDPSYMPLPLGNELLVFNGLLFDGADTVPEREARVSQVMPFTLDPEFSDVRGLFDPRVTLESDSPDKAIRYGSVFSFYYKLSQDQVSAVSRCVLDYRTPQLFTWDDALRDKPTNCMRRMHAVYQDSKERCKRFSACLWAYLLRLETLRMRSVGKVSS